MSKIVNSKALPLLFRVWKSLAMVTKDRLVTTRELQRIKKHDKVIDLSKASAYSDTFSYCYKLIDCQHPDAIYRFDEYSDREIGGDSVCNLFYDLDQGCLTVDGLVEASNKEKMEQHPSIGIELSHPFRVRCGSFNCLQLELDGDGEPVHVGIELESQVEGIVSCFGIITSKIRGWANYEVKIVTFQLPLQNMLVVGAENHSRVNHEYLFPNKQSSFYDRTSYDARRILQTEAGEAVIRNINLRLLGTKTTKRKVSLRSLKLVRRAGSLSFLKQYREPFFFIVEKEAYIRDGELGVSLLTKGYEQMSIVSLGDKSYRRKQ